MILLLFLLFDLAFAEGSQPVTMMSRNETLELAFLPYFNDKFQTFLPSCTNEAYNIFQPKITE